MDIIELKFCELLLSEHLTKWPGIQPLELVLDLSDTPHTQNNRLQRQKQVDPLLTIKVHLKLTAQSGYSKCHHDAKHHLQTEIQAVTCPNL